MRCMFAEERAGRPHLFPEQPTIFGVHVGIENKLDIRHPRTLNVEVAAFIGIYAYGLREPKDPDDFPFGPKRS